MGAEILMKEKTLPVVLIKWRDAWSNAGMFTDEEIAKEPAMILHTTGFMVRNDKTGVTVAQERCPSDSKSRHIAHIPRENIIKVKRLK